MKLRTSQTDDSREVLMQKRRGSNVRVLASLVLIIGLGQSILSASQEAKEGGQKAGSPATDSIVNFSRPRSWAATSGQPTPEGLEWIAKQGYRAVINFRTNREGVDIAAEADHARRLGMNYIHIPTPFPELPDEAVDKFLAAVADPKNRPVYIHCTTANRVGAFWMVYLVTQEGLSVEKAQEEAARVGLKNQKLIDAARNYLSRHARP